MSLDVTIKLKQPKRLNYWDTHGVCGSTVAAVDKDYEEEVDHINLNITHNMGTIAGHVPVSYHDGKEWHNSNLYLMIWRPDLVGNGIFCRNTSVMSQALGSGIAYMATHRDELLQYNPDNGWGSYDAFLDWLVNYKRACDENPDCEISIRR